MVLGEQEEATINTLINLLQLVIDYSGTPAIAHSRIAVGLRERGLKYTKANDWVYICIMYCA